MQEFQQLKKVRLGQDSDSEMESNPLSLAIQSDPISPAIRIPKEKFAELPIPPTMWQPLRAEWTSMVLLMPPNVEHFQ